MKLSLIIPAKDKNDPKLKELIESIESQEFPKSEIELLVITEGTSESAKAIGIKQAKGRVIGILASDNELIDSSFLSNMYEACLKYESAYPNHYYYTEQDDALNRYFALIGGNDPLAYYMKKNDRAPYFDSHRLNTIGSIGDNGYFVLKSAIMMTDLDNYYHIDNAIEAGTHVHIVKLPIWHKTGGDIVKFFKKRFHYGLQHAFNSNRRWHLVDFKRKEDICRLLWFLIASLTIIPTLCLSLRGYLKIRDVAWFLHPIVCLATIFTYGILMLHLGLRKMYQLLSAPMVGVKA